MERLYFLLSLPDRSIFVGWRCPEAHSANLIVIQAYLSRTFHITVDYSPWVGLTFESMSRMIIFGGRRSCIRSIQTPELSVNAAKFSLLANRSVSKCPIWLVEAACLSIALLPTIHRMA